MRDDFFEWDDAKAEANRRKHGVSFDIARAAFEDPFGYDDVDDDPDEDRWARTGAGPTGILFVIYTNRGPRIRIISARRANSYEQDCYHRKAGP